MSAERLRWFTAQVKKLVKSVKEVEGLVARTRQGLAELAKAKVVSLETYRSIRQAIVLNGRNLEMAKSELRKAQILMEAEANALRANKPAKPPPPQEAKVIPFRRNADG